MSSLRPLFISTFPPEACGLATFTQNLADSVDEAMRAPAGRIAAIRKTPDTRYKDRRVRFIIDNHVDGAYERAGHRISESDVGVVSIQHEFGLYSGDWGDAVLDLVSACRKPIVTTFHTLAKNPEAKAKRIIRNLTHASDTVVVMSETGRALLETTYGLPHCRAEVIPHGVPDVPFVHRATLRRDWGVGGRPILMTFGLLGRSKNIEVVIEALPTVLRAFPNALYVVAGTIHPNVHAQEGDAYLDELKALADRLGVRHAVQFVNRYLGKRELVRLLQTCDVYVVPYGGREQIVSGTVAYAMACGRAIVSTPFLYTAEVLAEGRGILTDFDDPEGVATAVSAVLGHPALREDLEVKAYEYARRMIWPAVGSRYAGVFRRVARGVAPPAHEPHPADAGPSNQPIGRSS